MAPPDPQTSAPSLELFRDLFASLEDFGLGFVVIGGMAVGAYARQLGETVVSLDLDLYVTSQTLDEVQSLAANLEARVERRMQARGLPVAVLSWRGREVDVLTMSRGLPGFRELSSSARVVDVDGLDVLVADPIDLLRNKLAVNRPKDQAHIDLLRRFIDDEIILTFSRIKEPRARIETASALLEVLGQETLESALAAQLVELASLPSDFRFLANRAPIELLPRLAERASDATKRAFVEAAIARRT